MQEWDVYLMYLHYFDCMVTAMMIAQGQQQQVFRLYITFPSSRKKYEYQMGIVYAFFSFETDSSP
jgi:hypothetical protein